MVRGDPLGYAARTPGPRNVALLAKRPHGRNLKCRRLSGLNQLQERGAGGVKVGEREQADGCLPPLQRLC